MIVYVAVTKDGGLIGVYKSTGLALDAAMKVKPDLIGVTISECKINPEEPLTGKVLYEGKPIYLE